ncbi:MAG TPA: glutamine amidotransferase [Aliidongia sp.]|nr:glutamine amidotransferase [Aliidongia sp.]
MNGQEKTALAVRHVAFEDLGLLTPLLSARGYRAIYREAPDGLSVAELLDADLLIVLGGPIGAYEEDDYPFLAAELRALERRLKEARPTLGICLGAQLMARALGASVYPGRRGKEIGWAPLALTDAGRDSNLAALGREVPVLHWHGDTFDLPKGSTRLASTSLYENQAFAIGSTALGLQFHLETPADRVERWLVGHAAEIAATPGATVAELRRGTKAAAVTQHIRQACLDGWLAGLPA